MWRRYRPAIPRNSRDERESAVLKRLLHRIFGRRLAAHAAPGIVDPALLLEISALIGQRSYLLAGQKLNLLAAAHPNDADVAMLSGQLALMRGESAEAVQHFERAARLAPGLAAAHAQLGALHAAMGNAELALRGYQAALAAGAESAALQNNLGIIYLDQEKIDDAQRCFESALRLEPGFAAARNNLGRVWRERHEFAEALECFRAVAPVEFDARVNVGLVLNDRGDHAQARTAFLACFEEQPDHLAMLCGLGGACIWLWQLDDAERYFNLALAREPANANARVGLANIALLRGEFAPGWDLYEARVQIPKYAHQYASGHPRWHGEEMPGRTLLVSAEQGYGDVLLFARFLPALTRARATVVFRCSKPLVRLLGGMPGVDQIASDASPVACDAEIPLLSLAQVLRVKREDLPGVVPYIRPPDALVLAWGERLAQDTHVRIGLVWGGNPNRARNGARIPEPDAFEALGKVGGITYYNLQVGFGPAELGKVPLALVDHSAELTDFADTAALIANLDLVIAVDTSVAHLAGAMGKPTWLLNSGAADWRWEIDGIDSPWYPSVRIFRRREDGWARTLAEVAETLRSFARNYSRNPQS